MGRAAIGFVLTPYPSSVLLVARRHGVKKDELLEFIEKRAMKMDPRIQYPVVVEHQSGPNPYAEEMSHDHSSGR